MENFKHYSINEVAISDQKIIFYDFGNIGSLGSVYIQGQLHSNEVNTFTVLYRLIEKLIKYPPPVPVRVVPTCNPVGWHYHLHGNDGRVSVTRKLDWNRIFHDIPIMDGTVEKELAAILWDLSKDFGIVIDIHTPDFGYPHVYTNDIRSRLINFEDLPYAIANKSTDGSFQELHFKEKNIPTFTLELPSHSVWDIYQLEYWAERIFQELQTYDEHTLYSKPNTPKSFGEMVNLSSKISGIPILLVEPNKISPKNTAIIQVIGIGGQKEIISFENKCIPLCFRRRGLIQSGRMICKVLSLQ